MCEENFVFDIIILMKRPSIIVDLIELVLGSVIHRYDLNASMNEIVLNY